MESPILHVMRHLPAAVERIAPEREDALAAMKGQVAFSFIDSERFVCRYFPESKRVEFSAGAMTMLWTFSHAYVTLYDRLLPAWISGKGEISLQEDPVVRDAMALLAWAITCWLKGEGSNSWPEGLIRPVPNPAQGTAENVADELSLCAAAFVLHHEVAHHRLMHTPREDHSENIQEEKDADIEAANWVLGAERPDSAFFLKRALGVSTALLALLAKAIHRGAFGGGSHPREFDRLVHVLDRFVPEQHRLWQFVILALKLHLHEAGIETPAVVHRSARACLEAYVEALAEAEYRWSGGDS
jgi:hypothetical protein